MIVRRLHHDPKDPDDSYAVREYHQILQQHEIDRKFNVSWYELFAKPSYRRRMIIGFIVLFGAQTTGTTVIASTCCLHYYSVHDDNLFFAEQTDPGQKQTTHTFRLRPRAVQHARL